MPTTPVKISKAEYAKKFGGLPSVPAAPVKPKNAGAPIKITKAEYQAKFGGVPAPKVKSTIGPDGIDHSLGASYAGRVDQKLDETAKAVYGGAKDLATKTEENFNNAGKDFAAGNAGKGALGFAASTGRTVLGITGLTAEAVGGIMNSFVPDWFNQVMDKGSKAFQGIGDKIHAAHPELAEKLHKFADDSGMNHVIQTLADKAKQYPDAVPVLKDAVGTILLGAGAEGGAEAPVAGAGGEIATGLGEAMKTGGAAVEGSGAASAAAARRAYVEELVQPRDSVKVKEDQLSRNQTQGKGPFKKEVTTLSPSEKAAADAVEGVPEVKPTNTLRENYRAIDTANSTKATLLKSKLQEDDFIVNKDSVNTSLDAIKQKVAESPSLVGDAGKAVQRMVTKAKQLLSNADNLGSSLMQVRKDFDTWMESQKSGVFEKDTPLANGAKLVRNVFNEVIDKERPALKALRLEQSSLFDAAENLAGKAAREAETAVGRFIDKVKGTASMKGLIGADIFTRLPATIQAGLTAIGGGGYILYKAGQLILKPELRIYLGRLLRQAGEILSPEDKAVIENIVYPNKKPLALPAPTSETPIRMPAAEDTSSIGRKAKSEVVRDPKTGKFTKVYTSEEEK